MEGIERLLDDSVCGAETRADRLSGAKLLEPKECKRLSSLSPVLTAGGHCEETYMHTQSNIVIEVSKANVDAVPSASTQCTLSIARSG
jgi:hypothetical protein